MAVALAVCTLVGCRSTSPPGPLELPAGLSLDTFHHAGSVLTGAVPLAQPEALETDPSLALALTVEVFYVERLPERALDPLTAHTRLVASMERGQPILPLTDTLRRARLGMGDEVVRLRERLDGGELGRTRRAALLVGALPERATCTFTARGPDSLFLEGGTAPVHGNRISLEVTRGEPALGRELSLAFSAYSPGQEVPVGEAAEDAESRRALYFALEEEIDELILLDLELEAGGSPIALVTANPRLEGEGAGFVTFLTIAEAPDPETDAEGAAAHHEALERCIADCRVAAELAAERSRWLSRTELRLVGFSAVLDRIQPGQVDRGFLVGLSTAVAADLVSDVALFADEEQLDIFAKVLAAVREQQESPETEQGIAWLLDRAAWRLLAEAALQADQPYEVQSTLLRHAGGVGRYPGSILEALSSCRGLREFQQRIVEENWMLLRDTRPGVRVRAFDWLAAQGLQPAGYEPMAPVEERRQALEEFARKLEEDAAAKAASRPAPAPGGKKP